VCRYCTAAIGVTATFRRAFDPGIAAEAGKAVLTAKKSAAAGTKNFMGCLLLLKVTQRHSPHRFSQTYIGIRLLTVSVRLR
jgi:hypothetical protein